MWNRRNIALAVLCGVLGSVAFTLAVVSPPATSAGPGHVALVALYGVLFGAALCLCGLMLGDALGLSPFSSPPQTTEAPPRRGTLPVAGSVVLLIVLWFAGGAILKRFLLSATPSTLETATEASQRFLVEIAKAEQERLGKIAGVVAQMGAPSADPRADSAVPLRALALGADAAWTLNPEGRVRWGLELRGFSAKGGSLGVETAPLAPDLMETLSNGLEVWEVDGKYFLAAGASLPNGRIVAARRVLPEWISQWKQIEAANQTPALRDEFLARRATRLNALLYIIVLLLLGGIAVYARPWSQSAQDPPAETEPQNEESSDR